MDQVPTWGQTGGVWKGIQRFTSYCPHEASHGEAETGKTQGHDQTQDRT